MNRFGFFIASAAVVLLAACRMPYGLAGGGLPANIRTVAVLPFENQTASPDLPKELYEQMREQLQKRLGVRDAVRGRADAIVRGTIRQYDADVPVSFSASAAQSVSARRRLQVIIDVEIVDQSNGRIIFQRKSLRAEGEYPERGEAEGRRIAIERLVNDVVEGAQSQW
jgi:Lipopolysaccharide-assembly